LTAIIYELVTTTMTEGKGYCHRRLRRMKQEQLQKDLEDLEKDKIVVLSNQKKEEH
jgi:hypothetical protein